MLALALHALGVLAIMRAGPIATAAAAPDRGVIDVVFERSQTPPTRFAALPEDRVDEAPENPELLSNVTSRARDEASPLDDDTPRLEGRSELRDVAIPSGERSAAGSSPPTEQATPAAAGAPGPTRAPIGNRSSPDEGKVAPPELSQMEMHDPDRSSPLTGTVSLSTTEWEYADWLLAFRRDFLPGWRAPSGYRWQLVHGRTRVAIRIGRNGQILALEVVGREGHRVLHDASTRALRRADPFPPLPDHFPDEELVMHIELIYPRLWR